MKMQQSTLFAYRMGIASRIAASVIGCYIVVNLFSLMLAYVLPGGPEKALVIGSHISFALYPFGIIWAFSARTATRAWLGLISLAVLMALVIFITLSFTLSQQGASS